MLSQFALAGVLMAGVVTQGEQSTVRPAQEKPAAEVAAGGNSSVPPVQVYAFRPRKNPFGEALDSVRPAPSTQVNLLPQAGSQRENPPLVRCGIIVVPASPEVDPGILVTPPEGNVDFKIRRITPDACGK